MISYPKLDRLTLQSVEKSPIPLKDPPRAIWTRRKDKVGDTQLITDEIDASCSRANDAISVYNRGINPMVKVNYSNNGNTSQSRTIVGTNKQAYYPYRIVREGAFRPPALKLEDLVPLSRLPRNWTYAYTNPSMPDFSKNMKCNFNPSRQVKDQIMNLPINPTATFIIQVPFSAPYDVKNVIKDNEFYSITANTSGFDDNIQINKEPIKEINPNLITCDVYTNISSKRSELLEDNEKIPLETKESLFYAAFAPVSRVGSEVMQDYSGKPTQTQDALHMYNVNARVTNNKTQLLPTNVTMNLERNIPVASAETAKTRLDKIEFANRNYRLAQKINPGGFENSGTMPQLNRVQLDPKLNNSKYELQVKSHFV